MQFHTYPPPPTLAPFIEYFWMYEADTHTQVAQKPVGERVLPVGASELVILLSGKGVNVSDQRHMGLGQRAPEIMLHGAQSQWYRLAWQPMTACLGIQFKPGGATPFLPLPVDEVTNAHVNLEAVWGRYAIELHERLMEAQSPAAQIPLLAQLLIAQALRVRTPMTRTGHSLEHHPAIAYALRAFETIPQAQTIAQVVEQIGVDRQRFRALFRAEVGLSPKQFCRIRRFLSVLRQTRKRTPIVWAELALDHGYYDQAHLINDFHFFAGMSPTAYLQDRIPGFICAVHDAPNAD